MSLKVEIEPDELVEKTADHRGRINLGTAYGGRDVQVLILESEPADNADND
jgi:hypothetical protein